MQEQTNYPEWQKAIREAQSKRDEETEQRVAKLASEHMEHKTIEGRALIAKLVSWGLDVNEEQHLVIPLNAPAVIMFGGYEFQIKKNVHTRYEELSIMKDIPNYDEDIDNRMWDYNETCLHAMANRVDSISNMDAARLADLIDQVNEHEQVCVEENARMIAKFNDRNKIVVGAANEPKLSAVDELVELLQKLIDDRIRESIAAYVREMGL